MLAAAVALLSCSRTFEIRPEGNSRETIRFSFYSDDKPAKLKIVEFVVQRESTKGDWSVVWELQGDETVSAIEYGAEYKGLSVVVPPEPISPGARYRALASELAWPNPKGHSAVAFTVDESGGVVVGSL